MNKSGLIDSVANRTELPRVKAERAVNSMISAIEEALETGEKVTLVGFGTFSTYTRPARHGRNPKTGSAIRIGSKQVVKFKSGTRLNREVR